MSDYKSSIEEDNINSAETTVFDQAIKVNFTNTVVTTLQYLHYSLTPYYNKLLVLQIID